jgi:NADPH:quinone reductase-like Zn-dependent oxidoreductase
LQFNWRGSWGQAQIIATASTPAKLDLALSLGADVGINYTQPGWTRQVLDATDGKGVDLLLEMVGGGSAFSEHFSYLALWDESSCLEPPVGRGALSMQRN